MCQRLAPVCTRDATMSASVSEGVPTSPRMKRTDCSVTSEECAAITIEFAQFLTIDKKEKNIFSPDLR